MSDQVFEWLVIAGYIAAMAALVAALRINISYQVTSEFLIVRWMGFPMRRFRHDTIKGITVRPVFFAESWCNCFSSKNRVLIIERHSGWLRNVVISPAYRFVFRAELSQARRRYMATQGQVKAKPPYETSFLQQCVLPVQLSLARRSLPYLKKLARQRASAMGK